ncbi:16646_t:CDS:2 [Entrophospora sp. SA101]|nr:6678_t:CDS:2 [Entrophospora candida]CAJ0633981.1 16646_t:CDS:2 [Entrophospora sp. SA101]CAJ0842352.1 3009_t:CDS:2 [Entrophospora sp. SA101]
MDNNGFSTEFLDESQVLHASFRVAAESVTQLYKTAFQQKNIGYEQCLKDLLEFIESHPNVQQRQQLGTDGRDAIISVDDLIKFMHLKKEQLSSLSRRSLPLSNTTDNNNQNIQHEIDRLVPSQDDSVSFLNSNDSLKRRYNHNNGEINFLGRQITLDSSLYEPSHKKGRFRKDES